jgi:hypothetical protein
MCPGSMKTFAHCKKRGNLFCITHKEKNDMTQVDWEMNLLLGLFSFGLSSFLAPTAHLLEFE